VRYIYENGRSPGMTSHQRRVVIIKFQAQQNPPQLTKASVVRAHLDSGTITQVPLHRYYYTGTITQVPVYWYHYTGKIPARMHLMRQTRDAATSPVDDSPVRTK
jgi:hypothetical protein